MRVYALSLVLTACIPLTAVAQSPSVASRLAAQNALFEEQYQSDLRNFPRARTAFGDYRYNDQLD